MKSLDWSTSPLGHPADWPEALKGATHHVLNSPLAMSIWWGSNHAYLFNDAHFHAIGEPKLMSLLGLSAREVWGEHWPVLEPDVKNALGGMGATWHRDRMFPRIRNGVAEESFWNYCFYPIYDASAEHGIGGVMLTSLETTERVAAERLLRGSLERQEQSFFAAPGFIAILRGPKHAFEYVNPAYRRLVGDREFIGRTVAEVLPEVRDTEYPRILDRVYSTGTRFSSARMPLMIRRDATNTLELRLLNFVYEPIKEKTGLVVGIFVEGFDVTDSDDPHQTEMKRKMRTSSHSPWEPLF